MNAIAIQIGSNIRFCRKRAGLSQEDLAFGSGLHRTEVSLIELGKRLPRSDSLVKLAGGLGVLPGELLSGVEWRPGDISRGRFSLAERLDGGGVA
jgi:transcriptional regulator with XRE-family HTH domain